MSESSVRCPRPLSRQPIPTGIDKGFSAHKVRDPKPIALKDLQAMYRKLTPEAYR